MTIKLQDETTLNLTKLEMQKLLGLAIAEVEFEDVTDAVHVIFNQVDPEQPVKAVLHNMQGRQTGVRIDIQVVRAMREVLEAKALAAQEANLVESLQGCVDDAHEAVRVSVANIRELNGASSRTSKLRTDVLLTLEGLLDQIRDLSCYVEKFE